MTLNLFDQFASPSLFGFPLILIAMLMPWLMVTTPSTRWLMNRQSTALTSLSQTFTKQIFTPLSTQGYKWTYLFTTLMMFIINMNLMGLLPYTFTPTTQLSLNLGLAFPLWFTTVLIGLRNQLTTSLAHFLPEGTPTLLTPILIIIETISLFIRPLALGVRLTANLTAGHLLIHLISSASLTIISSSPTTALITFTVLLLLTMLEIAVAMIQAYVFVLLLSLYLQENTYGPPNPCLSYSWPKPLTPH
uniref:ATP synthase subunit a n=1 Tax=Arthroleptis poecilonotus TaxID=577105 RepID=S4V0E5_ARTPO|nr:ATP synthase F0 subunit 6 [Arthroleptis poecilonotus]